MLDLATVTADAFRPHIDSTFAVVVGSNETLELTLVETTEFPGAREGVRRGFSLMFGGGSPARILHQATYAFRHAALGEFEIFIVPRQPVGGVPRYEATFN
ncbi:MAG: hypothetical protein WC538_22905 [Thermoanaerobaculia bacterium]|jgi:hypothetical protein